MPQGPLLNQEVTPGEPIFVSFFSASLMPSSTTPRVDLSFIDSCYVAFPRQQSSGSTVMALQETKARVSFPQIYFHVHQFQAAL